MGVYYIIVNDIKKEFIDPTCFDENCKFSGLFQGVHGSSLARMLIDTKRPVIYSFGYWACDSIRVVGDNTENDAYYQIVNEYNNISYHALAIEFENCTENVRSNILLKAKNNREILRGLFEANNVLKFTNLKYYLDKLANSDT